MDIQKISEMDRGSTLHPFTHLHDFSRGKNGNNPVIIEGAKGIRIRDAQGHEFIDALAGLYCVNVGYGREEIAEAIARQAYKLAYYHTYTGYTTDELAKLSDRLVKMAPGKMSKVFYGQSGSDANETQVKLVWYYNNLRGKPKKKKIIARERAYHGSTIVTGSLTGMSFYHDNMDLPVSGILRTGAPHYYWGANPGESELEFSARRARELEELILREDPETIGAFIAEPALGSGGLTPPPAGYWAAIQEVLTKYDILLIADEVVTGFGRTGAMFGSHKFDIKPDLITVAKGMTSAYAPLSAVMVGEKVYEVLDAGSEKVGVFSHGYTYSGHPIGIAAANATLDILEREDLSGNAASVGEYFLASLREAFKDSPIVGEVRGVGLMAAIEFVADPATKQRFDAKLKIGARVSAAARERGLIARALPHGDILGFTPPLVLTKTDVDDIVGITRQAVAQVANEVMSARV
ncbi:aminotransferase class III-fold pyridoxal phosphate-dependent enzyme [Paraburkholderia sp. CNPSo 3157]|uniref:Aminotransferase class III-fold pyridoxal phosphate-dependent enzyme n=1 Tax=Paraburkholderia franconis TaxID=2654983 RepID=A0A7X1TIE8_9BURK|nr:aminotransferase [Paraburkholderia franconis]MPW20413.1 aminotransferase class III-fold pyridoxal phosphate-dependent enzyme [Paraburkholderia franconis]